jgi:hypothetical protein
MEIAILAIVILVMACVSGFLLHHLYQLSKVTKQYEQLIDRYIEIRCKELGIK